MTKDEGRKVDQHAFKLARFLPQQMGTAFTSLSQHVLFTNLYSQSKQIISRHHGIESLRYKYEVALIGKPAYTEMCSAK